MAKKVEGYITYSSSKSDSSPTGWSSAWSAWSKHCSVYKRV